MRQHVGFLDNDFAGFESVMNQKPMYRLADVADKVVKVAFDVVKFKDSDGLDKLWVVQQHNGEDVIVAMYEEDGLESKAAAPAEWAAVTDKSGKNVNVFYKGEPITRFAAESIGVPSEESYLICRYLPNKLATDKSFRNAFLADLPKADRDSLHVRYPELG